MGKKVLFVEDEDNVRETISLLMQGAGYEVRASATGKDIFTSIAEFNPDLILLDILLDELDGREICREVKENPDTSHIPVIILSAVPEIYNTITDVGANDIVSKPFQENVLLNRIARQLANSRAHQY